MNIHIVRGWIKYVRHLKRITFLHLIDVDTQYVDKRNLAEGLRYDDYILLGAKWDGKEYAVRSIRVISKNRDNVQYSKLVWSEANKDRYRVQYLKHAGRSALLRLSRLCKVMRDTLEGMGFREIYTPTFCKDTREGARSFLVPSRLHPGKYYSLAQSPQIFKQLLISSGIDRYYQICSVFRDEDTRKDRLYGEFKQLDVEYANASLTGLEGILRGIVEAIHGELETDFTWHRMRYDEAIEAYGSDKPDLNLKYKWIDGRLPLNSETAAVRDSYPDAMEIDGESLRLIDEEYKYKILTELGTEKRDNAYLFVYDFPYYERSNGIQIGHNPFTAVYEFRGEDTIGKQFDLVYNGQEICSGGIRNNSEESFRELLAYANIRNLASYETLMNSWNGIPPHGGFAIGIERYVSALLNVGIRDVVAFPYTPSGLDLITNSPSYPEELDEETDYIYEEKR